jgi:hypothetical protein
MKVKERAEALKQRLSVVLRDQRRLVQQVREMFTLWETKRCDPYHPSMRKKHFGLMLYWCRLHLFGSHCNLLSGISRYAFFQFDPKLWIHVQSTQ